jgi:carboxyl-terminal processing protease
MQIKYFNQKTSSEFRIIMDNLVNNGLRGLIIDLRSNLGGDVESAVSIADYFIETGLIIRSQPRCGAAAYYMSHQDNINPSYPIVILINGNTASASEILAGCLHDPKHGKAVLVGERTFGKNTIQTISSIRQTDFKVKYGTAVYHFPSGQKLNARPSWLEVSEEKYGLLPDVEIRLLPHEIQGIEDIHRMNYLCVWNHDVLSEEEKETILHKTLRTDPQLAVGLFIVKSYFSVVLEP